MQHRFGAILSELKHHAPFTLVGAASGIVCMLLFRHAGPEVNHRLFQVFHPTHVVLSAIVTASLFKLYDKHASLLKIVLIGYFGAIGVATVSDCVLPFFGESLLGVAVPSHGAQHEHEGSHEHDADAETDIHDHEAEPNEHGHEAESHSEHAAETKSGTEAANIRKRLHLGFIEDWYVVNPAAILGIIIAWFWPRTKFPHAGHVLISTWASSFHVLMNTHRDLTPTMFVGIFAVLFVAVWLPCCISDIVFPLLFVKSAPLCTHHPPKAEVPS
jgi:hypothetical protein